MEANFAGLYCHLGGFVHIVPIRTAFIIPGAPFVFQSAICHCDITNLRNLLEVVKKHLGAWHHLQEGLLNSVQPTPFIHFHCNVCVKPQRGIYMACS